LAKRKSASINKTIWISIITSSIFYILIGWLGGYAYNYDTNGDLLSAIAASNLPGVLHKISQVLIYLFPIGIVVSSIPVFCIIIRYNLISNEICPRWAAFLLANVLPWIIAIPVYSGTTLQNLINWSSLIVGGFINFIIPLVMFIISQKLPVDNFNTNNMPVINSVSNYYEMDNISEDKAQIEERSDTDFFNSKNLQNSFYEENVVSDLSTSRIEEIKVRNYEEFPNIISVDLKIENNIEPEFHALPKWKWLSPLVFYSVICIFITLSIIGVLIYDIEHVIQTAVINNSLNSTTINSTTINSTTINSTII